MKTIDWTLYRQSQYASLDHATQAGATSTMRGITSLQTAETALRAAVAAVELLDGGSSTDDFRIVVSVNGHALFECALIDSIKLLRRHV